MRETETRIKTEQIHMWVLRLLMGDDKQVPARCLQNVDKLLGEDVAARIVQAFVAKHECEAPAEN